VIVAGFKVIGGLVLSNGIGLRMCSIVKGQSYLNEKKAKTARQERLCRSVTIDDFAIKSIIFVFLAQTFGGCMLYL